MPPSLRRPGFPGDAQFVMMPRDYRLSDCQTRDGMTVPMTGEAAWILPEGRKPYFRGTIPSLRYEFAM